MEPRIGASPARWTCPAPDAIRRRPLERTRTGRYGLLGSLWYIRRCGRPGRGGIQATRPGRINGVGTAPAGEVPTRRSRINGRANGGKACRTPALLIPLLDHRPRSRAWDLLVAEGVCGVVAAVAHIAAAELAGAIRGMGGRPPEVGFVASREVGHSGQRVAIRADRQPSATSPRRGENACEALISGLSAIG